MMTNWLPNLTAHHGPLYARLADAIEKAIDDGELPDGAKLPPQRNLAFDIGVTIGTVSRAYSIVRERGLVSGEVGRGTYVRQARMPVEADGAKGAIFTPSPTLDPGTRLRHVVVPTAMKLDSTAAPALGRGLITDMLSQVVAESAPPLLDYVRGQPAHWREAGARWLARNGWRPDPINIVQAMGGHAGILSVINAMTAPGDAILFETLTYSSVSRAAAMMGRRIVTVDTHPDGIDPGEFDSICSQKHPKMVFLMPDLANPALGTMSSEKRAAFVEVAARHNVYVIEDAIYASISTTNITPLAALMPERVFHVGGLSKSVVAGLRAAWVACPPHLANRVLAAHRLMSGGITFVTAETAARLVNSGTAAQIRDMNADEIAARIALVDNVFAGLTYQARSTAPFVWLKLPEPWLSGTFKSAAYSEGILIDDEDEFKATRDARTHHRVRVSVSAVRGRADFETALHTLRRLIDSGAAAYGRSE
jgi:DNA-binding transcriptional MocR family regulator